VQKDQLSFIEGLGTWQQLTEIMSVYLKLFSIASMNFDMSLSSPNHEVK